MPNEHILGFGVMQKRQGKQRVHYCMLYLLRFFFSVIMGGRSRRYGIILESLFLIKNGYASFQCGFLNPAEYSTSDVYNITSQIIIL